MPPPRASARRATSAPGAVQPERGSRRIVRADIQALRAAAVAAVVLFHLAPGVVRGGFVGVDVFFVVSGFLVGGALARQALDTGRIDVWQFFGRRARRIAPLAAVVAFVTIVWAALVMSPLDLTLWGPSPLTPTVTRDGIASVLGVPNLWMGISGQGYLVDVSASPFTHYWSLGVEEQFYVAAPLLLLAVFAKIKQYRVALLALLALCVLSFDLAASGWTLGSLGPFFNPLTRAWELGLGVLAALVGRTLMTGLPSPRLATPVAVTAWVGLGLSVAAITGTLGWPRPVALVPVLCTVAILVVGTARPAGRFAGLGVLRWTGDRSYGIYLWHWPFVILLLPELSWPSPWSAALIVVSTVVAASASYRWIESPIRRMSVATRPQIRRVLFVSASFLGAALITIVAVGVHASTSAIAGTLHAPAYVSAPAGTHGQAFASVVPINLRPSLTAASQDFPRANRDGCNVTTGRNDDPTPPGCVYGTEGPLIALFGDSHALQWLEALMPGVDSGDYRVALFTADGCPPFSSDEGADREVCAVWRPLALTGVIDLKPDLVLMSASTTELAWDDQAQRAAGHAAIDELARATEGMNVAWIADTPTLPWLPDRCAADDVEDIAHCSAARADALAGTARSVLRDEASAHGWAWLDLNDYLCDADACGIILGDVFMYRDDDHMTATFSRELATPLGALVTGQMGP